MSLLHLHVSSRDNKSLHSYLILVIHETTEHNGRQTEWIALTAEVTILSACTSSSSPAFFTTNIHKHTHRLWCLVSLRDEIINTHEACCNTIAINPFIYCPMYWPQVAKNQYKKSRCHTRTEHYWHAKLYTVGHKKRANLFSAITPTFLCQFLHFL